MRKYVSLFVLFGVVMALQLAAGWFITTQFDSWADRGTFGDMFGAVNTLFSGLAFAGIIYAIFLQSKELSLQRQELAMTRDELAKAADAQSQQAKLMLQSAKINAISSKLDTYTTLMVNKRTIPGSEKGSRDNVQETLKELQTLVDADV